MSSGEDIADIPPPIMSSGEDTTGGSPPIISAGEATPGMPPPVDSSGDNTDNSVNFSGGLLDLLYERYGFLNPGSNGADAYEGTGLSIGALRGLSLALLLIPNGYKNYWPTTTIFTIAFDKLSPASSRTFYA